MAIKVNIPYGQHTATVSGLYQWDYGQELEIESADLGTMIGEVHFACSSMSEAIVVSCNFVGNVCTVTIPNECLEQSSTITAWIYEIAGTQGRTRKVITIPVIARTRPSSGHDIPTEITDQYPQLITNVNGAIDKLESGQIPVKKAETATNAVSATSAGNASTATRAISAEKDTDGRELKTFLYFNNDGFTKYEEGDKLEGGLLLIRSSSAVNHIGGTSVFIAEPGVSGYGGVQYSSVYYDGNIETNLWFARLAFTPCDGNQFFTITPQRYTDDGWKDFNSSLSDYKPTIYYHYLVKYPTK